MLKDLIGKIWRKTPEFIRVRLIRGSQTTFTVSVGAVVVNSRGEVLLLDHVIRPGSGWGVPGGFIDAGEQPAEAVRREIMEETGLEIRNVEMKGARTLRRHVEILFRADGDGEPVVKSREIKRLGWFSPDAMPEGMSKSQIEIIRRLLSKDPN
jgi:8-oxo-dGTP diphosphatase